MPIAHWLSLSAQERVSLSLSLATAAYIRHESSKHASMRSAASSKNSTKA